jgi:uncharacterized protein (TIGR02646 family)
MIKFIRPLAPSDLSKAKVLNAMQQLHAKSQAGEKIIGGEIKSHWLSSQIRSALSGMQNGKCCYCDRKRDAARETDVEHYRPKATPAEAPKHPGYWWLAYEWENLLLACKTCNSGFKLNHFPLKAKSVRAGSYKGRLEREQRLIINPAVDDPEKSLTYDWTAVDAGIVAAKPKRGDPCGRATIDILGLNRVDLMTERANHFKMFLRPIANDMKAIEASPKIKQSVKDDCLKRLKQAVSSEQFCGLARAYFKSQRLNAYF